MHCWSGLLEFQCCRFVSPIYQCTNRSAFRLAFFDIYNEEQYLSRPPLKKCTNLPPTQPIVGSPLFLDESPLLLDESPKMPAMAALRAMCPSPSPPFCASASVCGCPLSPVRQYMLVSLGSSFPFCPRSPPMMVSCSDRQLLALRPKTGIRLD